MIQAHTTFHKTLLFFSVMFLVVGVIGGLFFMVWHPNGIKSDLGRPSTDAGSTANAVEQPRISGHR